MNVYRIEAGDTRLAIVGRPRGHDWLTGDINFLKHAGVDVLVSALTVGESEELGLSGEGDSCRLCGMQFVSFPIEDRSVPTSVGEFQKFVVSLKSALSNGKSVAIHCRAGIGRSSLIAAALLVAHGFSPDAAFLAIEKARGTSVPDTAEQRSWTDQYSVKPK